MMQSRVLLLSCPWCCVVERLDEESYTNGVRSHASHIVSVNLHTYIQVPEADPIPPLGRRRWMVEGWSR